MRNLSDEDVHDIHAAMKHKARAEEHYKRHPMYKEEVECAEKLRHTPSAVHSHDPAYENSKKNK